MGIAYFFEFDNGDTDIATAVDGKILADATEELDHIARKLELKSLEDYMGASDKLLEDFDIDPDTVPDANQWFSADEGIHWFESMMDYITQYPNTVKNAEPLLKELQDFRDVLNKAKAVDAKWHIAVDI